MKNFTSQFFRIISYSITNVGVFSLIINSPSCRSRRVVGVKQEEKRKQTFWNCTGKNEPYAMLERLRGCRTLFIYWKDFFQAHLLFLSCFDNEHNKFFVRQSRLSFLDVFLKWSERVCWKEFSIQQQQKRGGIFIFITLSLVHWISMLAGLNTRRVKKLILLCTTEKH